MATIETRIIHNKETGKTVKRYRAKIRLKDHPPEQATFDRKTDAEKWAQDREYELRHQLHFGLQPQKDKTVGDMIDRYGEALKQSNPRRYNGIRPFLNWWKSRLGTIKLTQLSKDRLITERDYLKTRRVKNDSDRSFLTNSTVNRMMGVLKRALNVAVGEWGWIAHNPLHGIKGLPEPKGRTRFLQGDELDRLLNACKRSKNSDLLATVVLAVTTGARRAEVEKIRPKDIDFKQKKILLPTTKNGKPRVLHLKGLAQELVKGIYEQLKPDQTYLFASPHDVTRPNDFRTSWRVAIKRAGIEDFKFHDLRHSAASYYAMHGAGLHQIAEILGHTS